MRQLCPILCLLLTVIPDLARGQHSSDSGVFENFVEGYVKDLFSRELTAATGQNLTDCMTRLLCENICHRTVRGEIKSEPLLNSAEMLGQTEQDPIGYFFTGGDRGYQFGRLNRCQQCASRYPDCLPTQYDRAKSISGKYERNMLKSAESSSSTIDDNGQFLDEL